MSSANSLLERKLEQLMAEMESDKNAVRHKAFETLSDTLQRMSDDVKDLLKDRLKAKQTLRWETLFRSASRGLQVHAASMCEASASSLKTLSNKKSVYSEVLRQIADKGNSVFDHIPLKTIFAECQYAMCSENTLEHFGTTYLKILEKHILRNSTPLKGISKKDWLEMQERVFGMFEAKCIPNDWFERVLVGVVEAGTRNFEIGHSLSPNLEKVIKFHKSNPDRLTVEQLVKLGCTMSWEVAVEEPETVLEGLKAIVPLIFKMFLPRQTKEEAKLAMFETLYLSLLLMSPVEDQADLYFLLRNSVNMITQEIENQDRMMQYNRIEKPSPVFVEFAARAATEAFWNPAIWEDRDEGQDEKRRKRFSGIEAFVEKIKVSSQKFSYRWILVLARSVSLKPALFSRSDLAEVLHLALEFQSQVQTVDELDALYLLCESLAELQSKIGLDEGLSKVWEKLAYSVFQVVTGNSRLSNDCHSLLSFLIASKTFHSKSLMEALLNGFVGGSVRKTNLSLKTLIVVLLNFNINLLPDATKTLRAIISVVMPASKNITALMTSSDVKPDEHLMATVVVLCTIWSHLYKEELSSELMGVFRKEFFGSVSQYKSAAEFIELVSKTKRLTDQIQIKDFQKSLLDVFVDDDRQSSKIYQGFPPKVVFSIDEVMFGHFLNEYTSNEKQLAETSVEPFEFLTERLQRAIFLTNMLDTYLLTKSVDAAKFSSFQVRKKIDIVFQEIEMAFSSLESSNPSPKTKMSFLNLLQKLLGEYHEPVARYVRSLNLQKCLDWVIGCLSKRELVVGRSENFQKLTPKDLPVEVEIHRSALRVLVLYLRHKGRQTEQIEVHFQELEEDDVYVVEPNVQHLTDVAFFLEISRELVKGRNPSEDIELFVRVHLNSIVEKHYGNLEVVKLILPIIPDFFEFVQPSIANADVKDDVTILVTGILNHAQENFPSALTIEILQMIKAYNRMFPYLFHQEGVGGNTVYSFLPEFLNSSRFSLVIAAAQQLLYTFDRDWTVENRLEVQRVLGDFYNSLLKNCKPQIRNLQELHPSLQKFILNLLIQMYCFMLCKNYFLQNEIGSALLDVLSLDSTSSQDFQACVRTVAQKTSCDVSEVLEGFMPNLVVLWLKKGKTLADFPWYISSAKSQQEFFKSHLEAIIFGALRANIKFSAEVTKVTGKGERDQLAHAAARLLGYSKMRLALGKEYSGDEVQNAKLLARSLTSNGISLEANIVGVVLEVLENTFDAKKATEMFGKHHLIHAVNVKVDLEGLQTVLRLLNSELQFPENRCFFLNLCDLDPFYIKEILFKLEEAIDRSLAPEKKLLGLFHFALCFEEVKPFLESTPDKELKKFFLKCCLHFLSNLIVFSDTELSVTAGRYLKFICQHYKDMGGRILLQNLTFMVSSLANKLVVSKSVEEQDQILEILEIFFEKDRSFYEPAIASLPELPSHPKLDRFNINPVHAMESDSVDLEKELRKFVASKAISTESLRSLYFNLATHKEQLVELYKSNSVIESSIDCLNIALHGSVSILVSTIQTASKADDSRSLWAAKCLGELGASDLGVVSLPSSKEKNLYDYASCKMKDNLNLFYDYIFQKLLLFVVDPNVKVKMAANSVAKQTLETKFGVRFLETYPQLKIFKHNSFQPTLSHFLSRNVQLVNMNDIFFKNPAAQYSQWIKDTCSALLSNFYVGDLITLINLNTSFAEELLPSIINLYMKSGNAVTSLKLEDEVHKFFEQVDGSHENGVFCDKEIVRAMLKIMECIRIHYQEQTRDEGGSSFKPNFENVVKAAEFCQAYFTAILYGEMWAFREPPRKGVSFDVRPEIALNKSLQKCYSSVGSKDMLKYLVDPLTQPKEYFRLKNMHFRLFQEMEFSPDPSGMGSALLDSGLYSIARRICESDESTKYETSWRLCDWSVVDELLESNSSNTDFQVEFDRNHYGALKYLHRGDEVNVVSFVEKARTAATNLLKNVSMESLSTLYDIFGMLQRLQQVEDLSKVKFNRQKDYQQDLMEKWRLFDLLPPSGFKNSELMFAQRICLLRGAGVRAGRDWVPQVLQSSIVNLIKIASDAEEFGTARVNMNLLKNEEVTRNMSIDHGSIRLIDADICRKQNMPDLAKILMSQALTEGNNVTKIRTYRELGELAASESSSLNPMKVLNEYFAKSIALMEAYAKATGHLSNLKEGQFDDSELGRNLREAVVVYEKIACYFDREYQKLVKYMKSDEFTSRKSLIARQKESLDDLDKKLAQFKTLSKDEQKLKKELMTNLEADTQAVSHTEKDRAEYASISLIYYMIHARVTKKAENLNIFRIISLWFANKGVPEIESAVTEEREGMLSLPSTVFLDVLPQISARLSLNTNSYTDSTVYNILVRCATNHPHHVIPHLMALKNFSEDLKFLPKMRKETQPKLTGSQETRTRSATKLLSELSKTNKYLKTAIEQYEKMSLCMIDFAYHQLENLEDPKSTKPVDCSRHRLFKLSNLSHVHCPTASFPRPIGTPYAENLISIERWKPETSLVGGVNAPKKLQVLCSDGQTRVQLLKGNDDLRQDAVMQQVFGITNVLLRNQEQTRKKKLTVRTYKVVPFSCRSGLLEWCSDTAPVGALLSSLHKQMRPTGMAITEARVTFGGTRGTSVENKLKVYREICKEVKPVLHHFFWTYFPIPGVWFESKQAFINSVATTSIVGYVLGIGDRHVNNILIDLKTGQLVHIDFGIAFDAGKCLPTPETTPFRMTREIVAGLGISGVDGPFRNSAELTMKVLRESQTTILGILDVLLYDPLYSWSLSVEKARQVQDLEYDPKIQEVDKNTSAERALQVVYEKLNGRDGQSSNFSSVEAHLDYLIKQSTRESLLCRYFAGWQPYL